MPHAPTDIITVLVENPKSGASRDRFALYGPPGSRLSVADYIQRVESLGAPAAKALADLRWDIEHGFIAIADPNHQPSTQPEPPRPQPPLRSEFNHTLISLAPGETLCHRYRLERELGRGGMGVVWLATDTLTGTTVAIKTLPAALARDERSAARLMAEALRQRSLAHESIVRVYDFARDELRGGTSFIVMQFVPGRTLDQMLAAAPSGLPEADVLRWATQIAAALDYAHRQKPAILHRDIKPANIIIDDAGNALLMDFGIGCEVRVSMTRLTGQGESSGTLMYMSPQHLMGEPPTPSDDIYALAATLYEALSGNPPFTHGDLAHQIRSKSPPALLGVASATAAAIAAALAKNADARPRSAAAMLKLALDPCSGVLPEPLHIQELRAAADDGNVMAMNQLGWYHAAGVGVPKDQHAAFTWYRRAAELGDAGSQTMLGRCFMEGVGTAPNPALALDWFSKAATAGNKDAHYFRAESRLLGQPSLGDKAAAFNDYAKAANLPHHDYTELVKGASNASNPSAQDAALQSIRQSARREVAFLDAFTELARVDGPRFNPDRAAAFNWTHALATTGHEASFCTLAKCYATGDGVDKDPTLARLWYSRAADRGSQEAREALARLA